MRKQSKSASFGLSLKEVPFNLCIGNKIDLSKWTLLATDETLRIISEQNSSTSSSNDNNDAYSKNTNNVNRCSSSSSSSTIESNNNVESFHSIHKNSGPVYSTLERPSDRHQGLVTLDLTGGKRITDIGIKFISASSIDLRCIILDNVYQMTEVGLEYLTTLCTQLRQLSLSGCLGISSQGFSSIGKNLNHLTSLKLSGCRQIDPMSFRRIFHGCKILKTLDLSYCNLLTDLELKILSNNCLHLSYLSLKECIQVSDVGLVSLSWGCSELHYLDLTRSDLFHKITDVALLALGERCKKISILNLHGCEKVTDTGLSWLSKGCLGLMEINLTNCGQISDGGMSYLANGCAQLKIVIFTRLKKVTDIGIRFLVDSCHDLEYINLSGVVRISDGIKTCVEGLNALGRSFCADSLKRLNLHGCVQISTLALKSIAMLEQLEDLTLSGCVKLTYDGISAIATSCTNIFSISLAHCGDCINDLSIEILCKNLKNLTTINFSYCEQIGRKALNAVASCLKLRRLDLTGCKGVNDDALLSLCDSDFCPGLSALYLTLCPFITNIGLSYISNGMRNSSGDNSLVTLSLKGTKIIPSALRATQYTFQYSEIKINQSYLGFWPISRVSDRIIINKYGQMIHAVIKIQAFFRFVISYKVVSIARNKRNRTLSTIRLQAFCRGGLARKWVRALKTQKCIEEKSILKIQCWFRCQRAKQAVSMQRKLKWLADTSIAVVKVQKLIRGINSRYKVKIMMKERELSNIERKKSSIIIQCAFRRVQAVKEYNRLLRNKIDIDNKIHASIIIEKIWRMHDAKKKVFSYRQRLHLELEQKKKCSALLIFRSIRDYKFRLMMHIRVIRTLRHNEMATLIQCFWRIQLSVQEYDRRKEIRNVALRNDASTVIQCFIRRSRALELLEQMQKDHTELMVMKNSKALVLTNWWRAYLARKRLNELKSEYFSKIRVEMELEDWAATKISCFWRGTKGRGKAKEMDAFRKGRWKQFWSDEEKRSFFYNQITGEIRWRKPQQLLNVEPRPPCSNCNSFFAQMECQDCAEFFCLNCWETIHFGGKRALHCFRPLFDYYGNRVDYGDEFPSRWPSEIEQDEFTGWKVRDHFED